jgi:hypothetical protein
MAAMSMAILHVVNFLDISSIFDLSIFNSAQALRISRGMPQSPTSTYFQTLST